MGRLEIEVIFAPWYAGAPLGRLTLSTSDSARPRINVLLAGEAAAPDIVAFPPQIDFGTVVYQNPGGATMRY